MTESETTYWLGISAVCGIALILGLVERWAKRGAPWEPWPPMWWMRLTLWWDCRRARRAAARLTRELARELAAQLHASNAWHCGCRPCVRERKLHHGDSSPRTLGLVISTRRVFGIVVETVQLTDKERKKL